MKNLTWNSTATKAGTATGSSSSASASSRLTKDGTNVDEYLEAYKAKRAQKETVSENSRLTKDGTNVDEYFEEYKVRRGARDTEAILSEYERLAKKYNDSIAGAQAYTSGGWKDASSGESILKTYEELKSGVDSLTRRTAGSEGVKNTLGHGRYYELLRGIESMGASVNSALGTVKSASENYGRYDSADAYNRAMKLQGMSRETLQSEVDRLSGEMEALLSNPDYKIKSFVSAGPRSGQPLPSGVQSSRNGVAQLTLDGMQKYKELEDQRVEYQTVLNEREYADKAEKYNADPRSLGYSDLMKLLKTAEQEKESNPGRYEFVKSYYDGLSESELYDLQGLDKITRLSKAERAKLDKIYELAFALESAGMATGSRFSAEYHMKKKLVENGMDEEEAESLANHYIRYQNALKRQASQQEYAESVQSSTGDAFRLNLLTFPANLIGGISSVLGNVSQYISNEISGKDIPLDPNAGYNKYTNFTSDVRSATQSEIEKAADFEIAGVNVAGTLYNTVMSGIDSGLAILAGGAIGGAMGVLSGAGASATAGASSAVVKRAASATSGLIMGSNAAGQEIIQSLEKGDSDIKALARGIAVGTVENITEKLGVDALFDIAHGKGGVIKKALQSFASEGTEEVISNWGTSLVDKLSGEGFRFETLIKQYTDQGYSRETAVQKAGADILTEDAVTFIAGGLTGSVMSVGFAVSSTAEAKQYKSMLDSEVNGSGYAAFLQGINERMGAISEISDEAEQAKAKEAVENSIRLRQTVIESAANNVRNTEVLKEYLGEEGFKAEIDHITEQKRTLDGILSEIEAGTYNVEERAAEAKELVNRYAQETAEGKVKKKAASYAENLLRQLGLKNADKTLQHNIELLETDVKNGVEGAAETLKFTREALASVKSYTDKDIANMLGGTVQGGDKVKVDAAVGVKLDHTMPQNAYAKYDVKTGEIFINPYAVATAEAQMRQSSEYSESNMAKVKVVHEAGHAAAQADSSFVSQMYEVYSRLKAEGIVASYEVNEGAILDTYKKAGVIDSYLNTSSAKAQVQKLVQDGASTEDATNAVIDAYMQEEYVMNFLEYVEKSGGKLYESLAPEKRNVFVRAVQKIAEIFRGIAAKIRGTNVSSAQKMEDMAVRLTKAIQRFAATSLQDANTATESVDSSVVTGNTTEGENVETGNGTAAQNEDARWSLREIHEAVEEAILNRGQIDEKYNQKKISRVPERLAEMVLEASGGEINISDKYIALSGSEIYHEYKRHSDSAIESSRDQIAMTQNEITEAIAAIFDPDIVEGMFTTKDNPTQRQSFAYAKKAHGYYVVAEAVGGNRNPNIVPVMIIQVTEAKWNRYMESGKTIGEMLNENDVEMLNALDVEKNKNNRVIAAQFVSQETIANTPHSPRSNNSIAQNAENVNSENESVRWSLNNLSKDAAIHYDDKNRASDVVKDLGLQLPAIFKDIQDSDVIVRDIGVNVNKGIENVTQSQQFKRWFGDWQNDPENASKVVNADGTPKVMYHGTSAEFYVFDASKNKNTVLGNGHYFGENVDAVKNNYAAGKDGRVIEVYLSIKNPFVVRDSQFSSIDDMPRIVGTVLNEENVSVEDIQNILKSRGYDGIQYVSSKAGNDIWVAFDSEQIKSATDNIGTFDGSNPDIRYSLDTDINERYALNNSNKDDDAYSRIYDMRVEVNKLTQSIKEFESTDDFKNAMDKLGEAITNDDIDNGVKAYQQWRVDSGYGALVNKRDALRVELENAEKAFNENITNKAVQEEKTAIEKSGLSEAEYFRKQAVNEFGYTPYFYDAGYITSNGKMLNFSGEKGRHFGSRGEDHRAIGVIYAETSGTDAMNRFMKDGNIRIMAESPGIDISTALEPTKEQYATIRKFINEYAGKEYFNVDLSDESGRVIGSLEYENHINSTRILNDIKHYFQTGEIREQSNADKFRYSLVGETNDGIEIYETSEEVLRLPWHERKKRYLSYVQDKYRGRTAKFVRNGHAYYAEFDRNNASKAVYGDRRSDATGRDALINTGADGSIFELVENSHYAGSSTDYKNHSNTDYFDYFVKTVQIDDKVFDILADVKKQYHADGGYVYTLRLVENKTIKASPIQRGQALLKNSGNALIDDAIVAQGEEAVNTSDEDSRLSLSSAAEDVRLSLITAEMSDGERAGILRGKSITNPPVASSVLSSDAAEASGISVWDDIDRRFGKEKRAIIKKLAHEFGVFKGYENADIDLSFEFSVNNFRESYSKQGHTYKQFAKMLSVFDGVVDKAVGIEAHVRDNYKPDPTLKNVYVLMSAFEDGENIVPVKLEVKEFRDKKNTLYVAVSLDVIKKTEVWKQGNTASSVTQNSRSVTISIPDLMRKVNPGEVNFTKYFPREILTKEQAEALEKAGDMRYSIASADEVARIARLKEDNTFLRAQMKAGRKTALSPVVLDNLLRDMRSAWGVSVEDNQAMKDMFRIVDNVSNSGKGMSDAVMERLRGMAEKLLSDVYVTDDQNMRENEVFIKHIKSMTLSVPADNESDLPGGYAAYRRQNMKYVKLARNGTPVDTVYDELCNVFPGLLDRSMANPADQIDEIVAVMKSLQPVELPEYSGRLSDASISFVNDIMAKYERGARETYSAMRDKKQQKAVDRASTAYEARIRQIEYRAAKDAEEYEAIIDRYQQKEWDGKMVQSRRDYSKSVLTNARAIRAAAVSPNQKKFIPEAYRESAKNIAQWLSDVSLFNGSITMDIANRVTADFARLSELYGEDFGSISAMLLDEVNSFANSQSEDHALKATYVMRAAAKLSHLLRRSIVNHNRIVLDGKKKSAADTGDALVRDLNTRKFAEKEFNTMEASGALERAAGNVRRGLKAISLNTMDGYSFLHRMGKVGDMLYDTLRAAQSKQVLYVKEYVDLLNDQLVYNKKTNADGVDLSVYTGNKPKMVEVTMANGAKMRMTAVQAMNIVSAYERAAGKEHIENGGVRLWDGEKKAYSRAFSLTATDVAALRSALDTDDLRVMDAMCRFIREDCTKWGNEATLERYGFHRFTTKDYFPLKVDRNAIPADMVKGYSVPYNVSNVGFAKATTEGASAPLLIDSFIDVVNRHVEGMATYAAYLSAEDTVNRIMSAPGVRDAMQRSLGSGSVKYMEDLMTALKGGGQSSSFTDSITDWWTKQAGHYKSAAVSYNASTAAKQPLSYIRALAVIDQKYLLKGLHGDGKSAHEQMMQYSGIGVKKDMGYSEVGVAKSIGNQIGYEKKGLGKVIRDFNEFGMKGASFMDKVTWDALWIACREEVLEMNPGISTDHTGWMEKTAKRFSEVVARTQVVDSPLDSAFKISRSNNPLVRNLFAFTNEPMKGFNLIMNSVNDLINTEKGSAAQKRARGALGKVLGVSVASWAMEALVSSIFRAVRDDDDDPGVVLEEFWPNMKSNMFGAIPYVAQLTDIISDAYNGYDFTDIGISNLVDIVESAKSLSSTLDNPESKQEKVFKQVRDLIEAVGTFAGIPIRNIDRTLVNATKAYFHLTDNYVGEYNLQKMFYNPNSNTAREKHEFNSLLADAYLSGDREAYEAIANDMRAHGVSTQAIIAGIAKDSFADDLANSDSSSLVKFKAGSEPWYIGMKAIFGRELGAPDGTEKEITRVYTLTGDTNILPKFKDGTYSVNKEERQIDGAVYDTYLSEYGSIMYEVVNAMRNMEAYRRASSAEQAWWITKAENYAAAVSIYHRDKEYNLTSRGKWIGEYAESRAVDVARYIVENLSR